MYATKLYQHKDFFLTIILAGGGVPCPVISGFMSGIGCIILILQVGPLVGFEAKPEEILANLVAIPEFLTNPFPQATILGLATIAVMYPTPVRVSHTLSS